MEAVKLADAEIRKLNERVLENLKKSFLMVEYFTVRGSQANEVAVDALRYIAEVQQRKEIRL